VQVGKSIFLTWLLLCSGVAPVIAQPERVITPSELLRFDPQTVEAIVSVTASSGPALSVRRRTELLALNPATVPGAVLNASPGTGADLQDIRITPGQYVVLRSTNPAREIDCQFGDSGSCLETPIRYLALTPAGESLDLSLVLASNDRMRFSAPGDNFVGEVFVQLRDLSAPDAVKDIGTKIGIVISAEVDAIEPAAMLEIDKTNKFHDAKLSVRIPADPTVVTFTPEMMAEPQRLRLDVARPKLEVRIGQERILGFGLETASVTVQAENLESLPTAAIAISSDTGNLNENSIQFDPATGVASTFVRSRGLGVDTITVSLAPFSTDSETIVYEKPWSWLIALTIGVIIGVAIRLTMRMKEPPPKSSVWFNMSIGVLGGLVAAALYALGINILPLSLPSDSSEVLTLILGALGAWVFPAWITMLRPKPPTQA